MPAVAVYVQDIFRIVKHNNVIYIKIYTLFRELYVSACMLCVVKSSSSSGVHARMLWGHALIRDKYYYVCHVTIR